MADSTKYGTAAEFDVDLHSIYAAYLGLFDSSGIDWWDKSWGGYFTTFNDFLGFGWEVMTVVDGPTGRAHIAVRRDQIALFAKMIRTRFGESLPKDPPTTLPLHPVPTRPLSLRRLITLTDLSQYRKLALTLPAAELSHLRVRVRSGEVEVVEQLFYAGGSSSERDRGGVGVRDNGVGYTWACVKTNWWEKGGSPQGFIPGQGRTQGGRSGAGAGPGAAGGTAGKGLVLEVGMAVVRCANLRAVNVWPPAPEENYRKSHFIVEEWVDKRQNANPPNYPRAYAFGKSRYVAEKDIERIVDATVGALASQENDSNPNTLILLTTGNPLPLPVPASSTTPANILQLDVLALEYALLRRAQAEGIPGTPDRQQPLSSLATLLQILQIPVPPFAPLGNAGNEAFYTVLAFQKLMMAETRLPSVLFSQPEGHYPHPYAMALPMPIAPFAQLSHSRRSSGSSARQSQYLLPMSRDSSPRGLEQYGRRASDEPRARPASMVDMVNAVPFSGAQRQADGEGGMSGNESVSRRRPGQMPRSQTVYWDDAGYAADARGKEVILNEREAESGSLRGRVNAGRGTEVRGVSWHEDVSSGDYRTRTLSEKSLSTPNPPGMGSRQGSSASMPSSPAHRVAGAGRPGGVKRDGGSNLSLSRLGAGGGGESGSSTRLSGTESGSKSSEEARSGGGMDRGSKGLTGQGKEEGDESREGKIGKGKMRSERSLKNLSGALTRFWVG